MLHETYDTAYKLRDYKAAGDSRPYLLISQSKNDDASFGSVLYERLEHFCEFEVTKQFGMSINEFLDLPRDVCDKILEISAKKQKSKNNTVNSILEEMNTG